MNNEELKAIERISSQITSELAATFGISYKAIIVYWRHIGKVKKTWKLDTVRIE